MTSSTSTSPKVQHYSDLRLFFSELYAAQRAKNDKFSQSSFATKIGISPSALTNFLENRRMLSEESLGRISKKLKWSNDQMSHATTLRMMNQTTAEPQLKEHFSALAQARYEVAQRKVTTPTEDNPTLRLISRALLASMGVPRYAQNPLLVADRLGLSKEMVAGELERLLSVGAIIRGENGIFRRAPKDPAGLRQASPETIRLYHRQMLTIASTKIRADNSDQRVFTSESFSFDPADLKDAQRIIETCLDALMDLSNRAKNPLSVYHANVQLFNLLEEIK